MKKLVTWVLLACLLVAGGAASANNPKKADFPTAYDVLVAGRNIREKGLIAPMEGQEKPCYYDLIDMADDTEDFGITAALKDSVLERSDEGPSGIPAKPLATLELVLEPDDGHEFVDEADRADWTIRVLGYDGHKPHVLVEGQGPNEALSGVYRIGPAFRIFIRGALVYFNESY